MSTRAPATPTSLFIALKGTTSLFAAMSYAVELIYLAQVVRLNPLQLVLVGTSQQLVCFLMQAPTGAWADVYSRRWAIVLGLALIGIGLLLEGSILLFGAALAAQAFVGLGRTLMDGADAAWIADEIGADRAGLLYLRATQVGWLAILPGIALAAGLGSLRLSLPLVVSGGLYLLLGATLALVMPERDFAPVAHVEVAPWRRVGHTLAAGLREVHTRPALLTNIGTGAGFGALYEAFGQLWQYHLLHTFVLTPLGSFRPIAWFGVIETVITVTNVLGIEVAHRRVRTTSHRSVAWALCVVDGVVLLGAVGFALASQFALALAGLWLMTTATGPRNPLRQTWINQHTETSVRATVFSLSGQVSALAAMGGGLLLGAAATAYGTRAVLAVAALVLAPMLVLYARSAARASSKRSLVKGA